MIKIKYGSTRLAIILFNWVVIKLPKLRLDITEFSSWKIKEIPEMIYLSFVYGVSANITESLIYESSECRLLKKKWNMISPLVPVLSIGFANFQFYQGENIPTKTEIEEFLKSFPPIVFKHYSKCNQHDVSKYNWRNTKDGLKIIDYGGQPHESEQLSYFLRYLVLHSSRASRNQS